MKLSFWFLLFCSSFYVRATKECPDNVDEALKPPIAEEILERGLEMLLRKLENMDRKLLELQYEIHELREQMAINKASHEKTFSDFLWVMHRLEERVEKDVGRNMTILQDQSMLILAQQTACASHDQFREKMFDLTPKNNQALLQPEDSTRHINNINTSARSISQATPTAPTTTTIGPTTTTPRPEQPSFTSCKDVPYNVSGVYLIRVNNDSAPFEVFCEQEKFGGGWIVVQHRFDGGVDFYRDWAEYREGFGNLTKEFWLGLEKMYQITTARAQEIIFEMKDSEGNYGYARYNQFKIGSECEQYSLKTLGTYSGTAGDAITYQKESKFSTKDRENDRLGVKCAQWHRGAWWYYNCTRANLNGPYQQVDHQKSMYWTNFKNKQGLSFSRMLMRET
ncbi:fibrinogen-like protein A [Anopheles darlingi]|uniref:fibrinogen-like protein A n=1 Tax=Anopheles darlingi TaxID=43151 RepID=UPI00210025A4|nr:fibrinogen-like protein A [Anopheles darlingi]